MTLSVTMLTPGSILTESDPSSVHRAASNMRSETLACGGAGVAVADALATPSWLLANRDMSRGEAQTCNLGCETLHFWIL